jgi:hypothetical protein
MERAPRIKPFAARDLAAAAETPYASALASLGFEQRCREIPEALDVTGVAVPFDDRHDLDFKANLAFFTAAGWQMPKLGEDEFFDWVATWLAALTEDGATPRIAVDVSSMSRRRIADVVEAIFSLPPEAELDVDFLYTPADFETPRPELEPPIFKVAPVSDYFAGWWNALEKPLFVIVGLGYELQMAAGALDLLEPQETQVFVPRGNDPDYLEAVTVANRGLEDWCGIEAKEVFYEVADPFACFRQLEAKVGRIEKTRRVAMLPLGPKIFALLVTLTAALHPMTSQVIRVTAGDHQKALPRKSDGSLFGITLSIKRPPSEDRPQG